MVALTSTVICVTDPGNAVGVNTGVNKHLRHGRDLMSDWTWGAWEVCSLDGARAWKRPEPTKWAVIVTILRRYYELATSIRKS